MEREREVERGVTFKMKKQNVFSFLCNCVSSSESSNPYERKRELVELYSDSLPFIFVCMRIYFFYKILFSKNNVQKIYFTFDQHFISKNGKQKNAVNTR